ncbi:F0F1 ATP synthase subunit epsilon [Ensifer soli]|uniref:F0F1 ATP synthase subunit epsilon n=1 Tax=Ciceribacter sp. sgz301302 TaxID=3342379 RepID=UPI0035B8BA7C
MADSFNFELVSPERLLISEKVSEVVLPATEGEMTVMAHHSPVMTTIRPGVVTVKTAAGATERYVVFGGFADIVPAGCTLLAESALHVKDVDRASIEARIEAAKADLTNASGDEHRTGLEQFLSDLTTLRQTVFAG